MPRPIVPGTVFNYSGGAIEFHLDGDGNFSHLVVHARQVKDNFVEAESLSFYLNPGPGQRSLDLTPNQLSGLNNIISRAKQFYEQATT